ncbi:MAG: acyl-CoA thioesterase [Candidatus Egerieousia sp.]
MLKSESSLVVRYYETDQMAIVHHSNYIRYFECGRNEMMKKVGLPIEVMEANGFMLPVVSVELHYKTPARMGDTLTIVSSINKWPHAKLFVDQEIYNQKGELVCTGKVVLCMVDSVTRIPVRLPQLFLDKIAPYFTEEEKNN